MIKQTVFSFIHKKLSNSLECWTITKMWVRRNSLDSSITRSAFVSEGKQYYTIKVKLHKIRRFCKYQNFSPLCPQSFGGKIWGADFIQLLLQIGPGSVWFCRGPVIKSSAFFHLDFINGFLQYWSDVWAKLLLSYWNLGKLLCSLSGTKTMSFFVSFKTKDGSLPIVHLLWRQTLGRVLELFITFRAKSHSETDVIHHWWNACIVHYW